MRLHVPVPFIARMTTKPVTIDGYTVPAGTLCSCHLWNLHHNPDVWEDPDEYKPERFSKENIASMDSFAFLPFSAGPRLEFILTFFKKKSSVKSLNMDKTNHMMRSNSYIGYSFSQIVSFIIQLRRKGSRKKLCNFTIRNYIQMSLLIGSIVLSLHT